MENFRLATTLNLFVLPGLGTFWLNKPVSATLQLLTTTTSCTYIALGLLQLATSLKARFAGETTAENWTTTLTLGIALFLFSYTWAALSCLHTKNLRRKEQNPRKSKE
jgi:hypothetical protein